MRWADMRTHERTKPCSQRRRDAQTVPNMPGALVRAVAAHPAAPPPIASQPPIAPPPPRTAAATTDRAAAASDRAAVTNRAATAVDRTTAAIGRIAELEEVEWPSRSREGGSVTPGVRAPVAPVVGQPDFGLHLVEQLPTRLIVGVVVEWVEPEVLGLFEPSASANGQHEVGWLALCAGR